MVYLNIRLVWLSTFFANFQTEGLSNKEYGPEIRTLNVDKVWAQNITGRNVVVAVLDDGVNYIHEDLKPNYEPSASYDFVENDPLPLPSYRMTHGTQCAGVIAARRHGYCRTGIAYNAKLAGIRLFDGVSVKTKSIVKGFEYKRNVIDIYSNSWGPADNGYSMRRPNQRMQKAFEDGAKFGRQGRGSIFVFSTGNGGRFGDSCAFDGYVNNIYTIAIGAFSLKHGIPSFAERCSSVLAAAYGDNVKTCNGRYFGCANDFGRTSAAAAMASGIIALLLEANNQLTWRDVQHLIVRTSNPNGANINKREWIVNGAGLIVHPAMGFGVLDAKQLIDVAYYWKTVPQQRNCSIDIIFDRPRRFHSSGSILRFSSKTANECSRIKALEHVQVQLSLEFLPRAVVEIFLTSPQRTKSQLIYKRPLDALDSKKKYNNLLITSLHFWGENPTGQWSLLLKSSKSLGSVGSRYGILKMLNVAFYGTEKDPLLNSSLPYGTVTCGRTKFWKGYGSECCGSLSNYDPHNERCCPVTYKVMSKNTTCNSREYNACTKMCCNGVIQNKVKNDVEMACCGINSYDGKKQVCCGGQLHPRYICKYGYRWWRYDRFTYENKCSSNRYVRLTYTNKPCPIPVQRKRVFRPLTTPTPTTETAATTETIQPEMCKDKISHCFRWVDCASFRTLKHKRENCAKTCGIC